MASYHGLMPDPSAEERLLRGLAELEASHFGEGEQTPQPTTPERPRPAPARQREPLDTADPPTVVARSLRRRGPFVALALPTLLGLVAAVALGADSPSRRGVLGFVAAVMAAPVLPVLGIPLRSGATLVVAAAVASAVLWLLIGWRAARRSTSWAGFTVEYGSMVLAVWIGTGLAALAADLVLGRPVL